VGDQLTMANPVSNHDLKIFSGLSNPELSRGIATYCGVTLCRADFLLCENGESDVEIADSVRGKNVYIVQSSGKDTNNHLMSLVLFIQACKLAGARSITAVLPLLPYARGDCKSPQKRKPIATKMIADMLEAAGTDLVITMDIHSPQTEGFFRIPVDCLTARHLFERWIRDNVSSWQDSVVASPDEGGTKRAGILAENLRLPMALIHKDRFNDEHVISGNVTDKQVILIDDMADSCYTINNAVKYLVEVGQASKVVILITHAIFSQTPQELFDREQVVRVVVTNTVGNDFSGISHKLEVIDISGVIGEAIRRNHYGESVRSSSLF